MKAGKELFTEEQIRTAVWAIEATYPDVNLGPDFNGTPFEEYPYYETALEQNPGLRKLFDELKKTSEEEDFEFIVVGIPEKRGVNEKYQEKFLNQYSDADKSMFEFKKIDRIFGEELLKQDIEYISLYNLAEENFDEFYFESDAHWKPNGVELSADYITEELEKRKII